MNKLLQKLKEYDFFWSIPLSIITFFAWGHYQEHYIGDSSYTSEWYHRGILACTIMLLFHGFVQLGMIFNHSDLYDYYNKSEDFKKQFNILPAWLKVFSFLFVYAFMFLVLLAIYHLT